MGRGQQGFGVLFHRLAVAGVHRLAGFGLLLGELRFEPAWQLSGFLLVFLRLYSL